MYKDEKENCYKPVVDMNERRSSQGLFFALYITAHRMYSKAPHAQCEKKLIFYYPKWSSIVFQT